jgi:hypothetical protein
MAKYQGVRLAAREEGITVGDDKLVIDWLEE